MKGLKMEPRTFGTTLTDPRAASPSPHSGRASFFFLFKGKTCTWGPAHGIAHSGGSTPSQGALQRPCFLCWSHFSLHPQNTPPSYFSSAGSCFASCHVHPVEMISFRSAHSAAPRYLSLLPCSAFLLLACPGHGALVGFSQLSKSPTPQTLRAP